MVELLEARLAPAVISWDGGGGDLSWNNPLNWSTNAQPGAADDVQIDIPGSNVVTYSSGNSTIRSLVSQEAIDVAGGRWPSSLPAALPPRRSTTP